MSSQNRLRLARTACDLFILFVATICVVGSIRFFVPRLFMMLTSISLFCGAITGVGFGLTESKKVRRWLGAPVFAMCIQQLIIQSRVAWAGKFDACAIQLSWLSGLTIAVLLAWLCDYAIGQRIPSPMPLTRSHRFWRLFHGILAPYVAMCVLTAGYYAIQQPLVGQILLASLVMVWYATFSAFLAYCFWEQTSNPNRPRLFEPMNTRLMVLKLVLIGAACKVCSMIGYASQGGQSSWEVGVAMVLLAFIAAVKISQLKGSGPKPSASRIAATSQAV